MQKKILVLVSNPKGTSNLNLLPEIRDLQEALQRSQHRERFAVEWRVAKHQTDLRRYILDSKPQIIHFCGHGTEQGLVLEDDTGTAKVVPNEVLVGLLQTFADRIECVLLNACDSENLADRLVQHLNYVIGMNQEVYDDAAIAFAEGFYDTLGAGEYYERAFEVGKNAVLGKASSRGASRKATVVGEDGSPVKAQNQEHLIPVLKTNPTPTPIKPLWLSPEVERDAIRQLLGAIEGGFNTIKLFHADEPIVLKDQYIPVQVTLERRYQHTVETIGGYAESEAELKRIYALKGGGEEEIKRQQVDWQEARRQEARIVVLADPGMGKSTLLRMEVGTTVQQAYQALEAGRPLKDMTLPLLIRLSTLADEIAAIPTEEAILKIIQERHSNLLKHHANAEEMAFLNGLLKEQLLSGKVLLLLDALDEVPDGKRKKLLEKLNEFAQAYPTCAIVGTSRIVGYGGRLVDGAKDMEIVPFSQKQTEEYIETWFSHAPLKDESVSARGLIQALRERPQIAGLAQNPLLLSLLCSLYQRDRLTLPARRSQIYEQSVTCMLSEWGQTRLDEHDDKDNKIEAKTRLLEALAYHFTCEGQEVFDYEDLFDWVEGYLEDGDAPRDLRDAKTGDLIAELSESDGILQKLYRDKNDDQYLFLHRTFQEYFTASYLKRSLKKNKKNLAYVTELVRKYCWNYDWHKTLTLLAGLMENPIVLIETITAEKDDLFQTQLLLTGRCITECGELSDPLVDEIVDRIYQFWLTYPYAEFIRSVVVAIGQTSPQLFQILQAALSHEDSSVRFSAAFALGKIGNEQAVDALIQALSDEDSRVRYYAAFALGEIGNEQAVDALIQALSDEDSNVRYHAAEALGKIGNEQAVDGLIQVLSYEDSDVRSRAAEALEKIGNEQAVDGLIQALSHENSDVRFSAASALERIGNEQAVDGLIQALSHEDSDVRYDAAFALERIGNEQAVDGLIQALSHEDSEVRFRAASALERIGNEQAVDGLIQALSDEDSDVRFSAASALERIGNEQAVDGLIQALSDEDSDVRFSAASALGKIGNEQAVDALIQALSHEDSEVRFSAAEALGKIGNEQAVDVLIQALSHEDSDVRFSAASALERIGNEQAVDVLIQALSHENSEVRFSAAEALVQIGNEQAVDVLIQALSDEDPEVRFSAAFALGKIGNEQAVDALIQALSHEDSEVRYDAAFALGLGKIGNEQAVDVLIQTLSHEDSSVRFGAAFALEKIGNGQAVDALIQALSHEDLAVRFSAASALKQIDNEQAVDVLIQALSHENSEVRYYAAEALKRIGNEQAVDGLIQALSHEDSDVRFSAAFALEEIGNEQAVDALIQALSDEDSFVRLRAASALERIGNEQAVDALIQALSDEDSFVRLRAASALGEIGNEQAVDALIQALSDENSEVRYNAAKALELRGSAASLEKLLQLPNLSAGTTIFSLARNWAIRFSKAKLSFIPVYPELLPTPAMTDQAEA